MGALGGEALRDREPEALGGPGHERDAPRGTARRAVTPRRLRLRYASASHVLDEAALGVGQVAHAAQPVGGLAHAQRVEIDVAGRVGLGPGVADREQPDARARRR